MDLRLDGRRVVLTAGGAGIGRVTLQTLVEAGARVVTCDVDQAALDRLRGELPTVPAIPADVADEAAVDRLFELALEQLGGLDILVNNAGIAGPTGPIEEIAPEDWRRTLEVNITGQYLCARRAVPHIRAGRGGGRTDRSRHRGQGRGARRAVRGDAPAVRRDRLDEAADQPEGHRQHDPVPVLRCRPLGLRPGDRGRR